MLARTAPAAPAVALPQGPIGAGFDCAAITISSGPRVGLVGLLAQRPVLECCRGGRNGMSFGVEIGLGGLCRL